MGRIPSSGAVVTPRDSLPRVPGVLITLPTCPVSRLVTLHGTRVTANNTGLVCVQSMGQDSLNKCVFLAWRCQRCFKICIYYTIVINVLFVVNVKW